MNTNSPLSLPIGLLMRPTYSVEPFESLEVAVRKLRENGASIIPVIDNGNYAGVICERVLTSALAAGMELSDPVEAISHGVLTAHPSTTGAEALRLMEESGEQTLVVIDANGKVLGILSPTDLFPKRVVPPRPPVVGGMATPFGVHLTTGGIRAGVPQYALVATGFVMFTLLAVSDIISFTIANFIEARHALPWIVNLVVSALPLLLFLAGMRLIPLSGIHAAEHKVVHAIERGEELTRANVRRMPRVHPRCGTNIAAGAAIFLGLSGSTIIPWQEFRGFIAIIATLFFWKPLGSALQYYVTTKKPTEKQLDLGIKSGNELLAKYATMGGGTTSIFGRIYNSGLLHVMAGSTLALGIFTLIAKVFNLDIG